MRRSFKHPGIRLAAIAALCSRRGVGKLPLPPFRPEDGLNTAISQILQDRTGFLWVGTADGLFRYDGAHFQRFGVDEGLPSASIRNMIEATDGTLWVVTGRGLARRRKTKFETVSTGAEGWVGDWHSLGATRGRLYLGTDRGLLVSHLPADGGMPRFALVRGAPSEPVEGLYAEANGDLWFGCGLQLCLLEDGLVRKFGSAEGLPPEPLGGHPARHSRQPVDPRTPASICPVCRDKQVSGPRSGSTPGQQHHPVDGCRPARHAAGFDRPRRSPLAGRSLATDRQCSGSGVRSRDDCLPGPRGFGMDRPLGRGDRPMVRIRGMDKLDDSGRAQQ